MFKRGAGPEYTHLAVDLFVSDAVVIGMTAARGFPQFVEDLPRGLVVEEFSFAQAASKVAINLPINASVPWRVHRLLNVQDAAFDIGDDAFVLLLQAASQDHVGMMCGLRKEEVHHAEKLEFLQRLAGKVRIGQRDQW